MHDASLYRRSLLLTLVLITVGCGDDTTGQVLPDAVDAILFPDTATPPDTAAPDTAGPADADAFDSAQAVDTAPPEDSAPPDTATPLDTATPEDTVAPQDSSTADDGGPPSDTWNPGCTPLPFAPPGPTADWDHPIATPITRAFGAANHRGQDVVVKLGEPQLLIGKFAYGFLDDDLEEEMVDIYVQRVPPCGAWEKLGEFRTSEDGQYGSQFGLDDDGGRVFFTVPAAQALPVGRFPIRMLVRGDHSLASFDLVVVSPDTSAIVFDIDGTLTTGDSELITEIVQDVFNNTYDQALRAGAVETAWALFDKGYLLVYLSGRPDLLRPMTERWLEAHAFPPGALHLTDTNGQVLPTEGVVGTYKTACMTRGLGGGVGLKVYAAYGNATTDIYAYANVAFPKERTFIVGPHGGEEGTVDLGDDYLGHLPTAQAMPAAAVPAPPAENGWW